jgi:hypothetical protein
MGHHDRMESAKGIEFVVESSIFEQKMNDSDDGDEESSLDDESDEKDAMDDVSDGEDETKEMIDFDEL